MASLTPEGLELGAVRDVPFATSVTMARGERPDVIPLTAAFRERYALSRVLGHGGMGMVVLAQDREKGSAVAIKFLTRHGDMHELKRFLREGRLLRKMRHPNLLPVLETDQQGGYPYLVMPYVAGGTLRSRMPDGVPLPQAQALPPVLDVLEALAACHYDGIVHRDVKPENVLLEPHGRALLADLGIAKTTERFVKETSSGIILGTPRYMSPEQATGGAITPASDVYSAASMLYEMLAGRPLFDGNVAEVIGALVADPAPPLAGAAPGVDPKVAQLVDRALAKEPGQRPADGAAFADELRAAAGMARATRRRRGLTRPVRVLSLDPSSMLPALVTATLVIAGALILIPRRAPMPVEDEEPPPLRTTSGELLPGRKGPGGMDAAAFAAPKVLWQVAADGIEALAWAPDGSAVVAKRGPAITRFESAHGVPEEITDALEKKRQQTHVLARSVPGRPGAALSPDGRLMAAPHGPHAHTAIMDGRTGKLLLEEPVNKGFRAFAFSPDGRKLAAAQGERLTVVDLPEWLVSRAR